MAYEYDIDWDGTYVGKGKIEYNCTPCYTTTPTGKIGPGTKITITGRFRPNSKTIKSIAVALYPGSGNMVNGILAYANKTGASGSWTNFSLAFEITKALWDNWKAKRSSGYELLSIGFAVGTKTMTNAVLHNQSWLNEVDSDLVNGFGSRAGSSFAQYTQNYLLYTDDAAAPVLTTPLITDGSDAMTLFHGMAQGQSTPHITASWAYDSKYADQMGHVEVTLTGAMTGTYTADKASGVTSATFDLPTPTAAGTVNWSYTVTDMFGNTDTETGSFTVYAYSPPAITNLLLERYAIVPDAGGDAHEAADDGTHLWLTLAASIAAVNSLNAWTAVMTYWETALGESTAVTVTSQDGWTLGGTDGTVISLSRDETQLAGIVADDTKNYSFRLTITDALNNSATLVFDGIVKAGAVLDVSPGGVGVGKRCTGTEGGGELFQCAYPAYFDGNVAVTGSASFGGNVAVGANKLLKVYWMRTASRTVKANGYTTYNDTMSPGDGWTPLAVVGYYVSAGENYPYTLKISGNNLDVRLHNSTATAFNSVYIDVYVLCIRTSL